MGTFDKQSAFMQVMSRQLLGANQLPKLMIYFTGKYMRAHVILT